MPNQSDADQLSEKDTLSTYLKRTNMEKPAKKDVWALQDFLQAHPQMWSEAGDLAKLAAQHFIREMAASASIKESLKVGYKEMMKELAHPQDSPLESLLIQNVVLSWMRLAHVEYQYTAVVNDGGTYRKLEYWEKRLNASQRRFLRASESLTRIRKLAPPVQINIAQQQVNQLKA